MAVGRLCLSAHHQHTLARKAADLAGGDHLPVRLAAQVFHQCVSVHPRLAGQILLDDMPGRVAARMRVQCIGRIAGLFEFADRVGVYGHGVLSSRGMGWGDDGAVDW
ncbi:hypothetical protein D3C72_2011950 [compost metagenome]